MKYIFLKNIADPFCNVVAVNADNVEYLGADELFDDYGQLLYGEDDLPSDGIRAISYWDGRNNRSIILDNEFYSPIWEEVDADEYEEYMDAIKYGDCVSSEEKRGLITEWYRYEGYLYPIRKSIQEKDSWFEFEILEDYKTEE